MTIFDPEVGDTLVIDSENYFFRENPGAPGFVHAQDGRFGTIYCLIDEQDKEYALKKFLPTHRKAAQIERNSKLKKFANIAGMRVCERSVLTDKQPTVKKFPDLLYSIKMPWVKGKIWSNYLADRLEISPAASLSLAKILSNIVFELEKRGLAHCDLSSGNIVIEDDSYQKIQLIDVEGMYWDQLDSLDYKLLGTPGYAPEWLDMVEEGVYCQEGDRFAGAILLSEVLCWQFSDFRQKSYNETSYFDPMEVGKGSPERYKLMLRCLNNLEPQLGQLLERTWKATSLQRCPTIQEWHQVILEIRLPIIQVSETRLDFGVIDLYAGKALPSRQIRISNVGQGILQGSVQSSGWLILSHQNFNLRKSESFILTVSLKPDCPRTSSIGQPYSENAVMIRSSSGGEVNVAISYSMVFPELAATNYINFTKPLDRAVRLADLPVASLAITNTGLGQGQLTGQVKSKVPWLEVQPTQFSLGSRQSTIINVTLNKQTPQPASGDSGTFANSISISSNAGSLNVSGKYTIQKVGLSLVFQWLLVSILMFVTIFEMAELGTFDSSPVLAILLGAIVFTVPEWWILRHRIRSAGWWIPATIVGLVIGVAVLVWGFSGWLSSLSNELSTFISFAILGIGAGLLQSIVLKKSVSRLWIFMSASILAWVGMAAVGLYYPDSSNTLLTVILLGVVHGVITGTGLWYMLRNFARQSNRDTVTLNWSGAENIFQIIGIALLAGLLMGVVGTIPAIVIWFKGLSALQIIFGVAILGAVIFSFIPDNTQNPPIWVKSIAGLVIFGGTGLIIYGLIWLFNFMGTLSAWQNILVISVIGAIISVFAGKQSSLLERAWNGFIGTGALGGLGYGLYLGLIYVWGLLVQVNNSLLTWLNSVLGTNWQAGVSSTVSGEPSYDVGIVLGFLLVGGACVYFVAKGFSGLGLDEDETPKLWTLVYSLPLLIFVGLFVNIAFTHVIPLKAGFAGFGWIGVAVGAFLATANVLKEDYGGDWTLERGTANWLRFFILTFLFLVMCGTFGFAIIDYAGDYSNISATRDWQSSSVKVQEGDLVLLIQIGGTWSADPANPDLPFVGAMGYPASSYIDESWKQYRSYPLGQLMAKTYNSKSDVYPIGIVNVIRLNTSGTLYLKMNDANLFDNNGSLDILVVNLNACLRKSAK